MSAQGLLRGAAAALVGVGVVVAVLLFAQSHDDSAVQPGGGQAAPGRAVPAAAPARPAPLRHDGGVLTDDEVRTATQAGDVVLLSAGTQDQAPLRALQQQLGPFDPKLASLGQSVVVGRRPGLDGVLALAKGRELAVHSPGDARLEAFVDAYLGSGGSS